MSSISNVNGKCVVCGRYKKKGSPQLSLFSFPSKRDSGLAQQWLGAMNLDSDKIEGKICHHHFPLSAFTTNEHANRRQLHHDAIPTLLSVEIQKPAEIDSKIVITPREISFQEFNELERKYNVLKRKLDERTQELRIQKQKNKRHETALKKVTSDCCNKGEVVAEAEKNILYFMKNNQCSVLEE